MFHSRALDNKINRIHKRALMLVYSDNVSSFDELLKKDQSFSIHHRKIRSLTIVPKIWSLVPNVIKSSKLLGSVDN